MQLVMIVIPVDVSDLSVTSFLCTIHLAQSHNVGASIIEILMSCQRLPKIQFFFPDSVQITAYQTNVRMRLQCHIGPIEGGLRRELSIANVAFSTGLGLGVIVRPADNPDSHHQCYFPP